MFGVKNAFKHKNVNLTVHLQDDGHDNNSRQIQGGVLSKNIFTSCYVQWLSWPDTLTMLWTFHFINIIIHFFRD